MVAAACASASRRSGSSLFFERKCAEKTITRCPAIPRWTSRNSRVNQVSSRPAGERRVGVPPDLEQLALGHHRPRRSSPPPTLLAEDGHREHVGEPLGERVEAGLRLHTSCSSTTVARSERMPSASWPARISNADWLGTCSKSPAAARRVADRVEEEVCVEARDAHRGVGDRRLDVRTGRRVAPRRPRVGVVRAGVAGVRVAAQVELLRGEAKRWCRRGRESASRVASWARKTRFMPAGYSIAGASPSSERGSRWVWAKPSRRP
jgi:hypothetical protein